MRAALPHTEGFVDRDGINLHFEIYGESEHTILFVPTWAIIHSRNWKAQIPYFAEHFRVISFDPRGNGKSDRPENSSDYSFKNLVEDVIAVLDSTETETATLVGMSFSAGLSFAVAAYFPDRVNAVVSTGGWTPLVPPLKARFAAYEDAMVQKPQGWEKYNAEYWKQDYPDFLNFFIGKVHNEPHSTKYVEDAVRWGLDGDGVMLAMTLDGRASDKYQVDEEMYRRVQCPSLVCVGDNDEITPTEGSYKVAALAGSELHVFPGAGHGLHGRYSAKFNTLMRDFLARELGTWHPNSARPKPTKKRVEPPKRALYLSSPIGLGHARRDLAITQELRALHPDLQVDWLAQDPVTRFLAANDETIHPDSHRLANESTHIEEESGEHDLNAFQAIRNMDEILAKNFMVFQDVMEQEKYDLVIADEAWDVDHFWHEHPELKKAQIAWLTDFVGWVPMPENGAREAFLTTNYNAEMIGHVEGNRGLRDRSIFVGNPDDIIPHSFGANLPQMRDWVPENFDFSGYILGRHPDGFGDRDELRQNLGYRQDQKICIVTVGGSAVGGNLIRRVLAAYPFAKAHIPELRMIIVTGPRLNPAQFKVPRGVEIRAFVPDLDRHLAACDLALVQGGLTTTMELTAAGTPFLYFPLKNHFEQNFHVAHRLDQYNAGRKMIYDETGPEQIAVAMVEELSRPIKFKPVESGGAARAAKMISDLL
jgi:pimeloyl-ACP methyl ester carboxylesterase/predicted glycosyltransferase